MVNPAHLLGTAVLLAALAVASSGTSRGQDPTVPPQIVAGQSTPTIRLMIWHGVGIGGNYGYLDVDARQVRFEVTSPENHKVDGAFTWSRSQIVRVEKVETLGMPSLHVTLKDGKRHTLLQLKSLDSFDNVDPTYLALALQNFPGALAAAQSAPIAAPSIAAASPGDSAAASAGPDTETDQSGVFIDGGKGIFVGKRLAVTYRNDCQAGDPDFQLLQDSVTNSLFAPGRFLPSANSSPELILHLALTQLQGIDGATDALDILGLADQDAKAVATFQLTDARGKVVRSGTVVANVKDDGDNDPYRRDAIHQLANQLASYLTQ